MTVPEQVPVTEQVANGATVKFFVQFQYANKNDLHIFVDGVEPSISEVYFYDNAFNFYAAPAAGKIIKIQRITPKERDTDYDQSDNTFRPRVVNADFDKIWYVLQEVFSDIGGLSQTVQDEIIARIQGDEDLLNQLSVEISARILGDEAVTNDLKDYVNQVVGAIINDPTFNGIDASKVNADNGETQQQVNDRGGATWYAKSSGYALNDRVILANGDEVKSIIPNNTSNPNTDMTGWVKTNSASQFFYSNGDNLQDSNSVSKATLISVFDFMTMSQFKAWKSDQENYNATFALQAALDAADVFECLLPQGTYLHSGLVSDKNNFTFYGNGYARSILKSDNSANVALHIAKNVTGISGFVLRNIKLLGNVNSLRGIQLGDAVKYVQFCQLDNCMIDGFTKSDACDIYLGSVQELDVNNTMSWRGNIGIYRPSGGYGTSIQIRGKAGYLGRHAKHGIKIDGPIDDIYIQDNVIEGNGLEAIYINNTAFKGTQGVTLYLQNAYFEANGNSSSGNGVVYAKGTSDYLKLHKIYSSNCNFAANPSAPAGFKNFAGEYVMLDVNGSSNILPNTIGLTNSYISYRANLTVSAGDVFQQLKDLSALTGNKLSATGFNYLPSHQNSKNFQTNFFSSVTFPVSAVLSTDTTTIDDYREVSDFVPAVTGNGGTVSAATCRYTKIGNLVNFAIQLTTQNFTSTQGTTKVSLPHTQLVGTTAQFMNNQNYTGGFALVASQAVNLPTLAAQGSVATIYITGSYMTAQ